MTLAEVNNMMAEITQRCGLTNYTYYQFADDSAPNLPYLIFYYPSSANDGADNVVWQKINHLNIELYTDNKDFAVENAVESALNAAGLVFSRAESYIDADKMYMVVYTTEIILSEVNNG